MFVDDEPQLVAVIEKMLAALGYQVTVKTNPIAALELFKTDPMRFDMIITDMTMPQITGDVLAAEVLKIRPDIPVILCSGYNKKIDEIAKAAGIKAYLSKPIAKMQLASMIRKVLDESKV